MKIQNQIIQLNPILESLFGKFGFSKLTEIQKKASSIILQKKRLSYYHPNRFGKN